MKSDGFPFPRIEEILDDISDAKVFTKLDMFTRYWKIQLVDHTQQKKTFTCKYGAFQFAVMPFGLMNVPYIFKRMASGLFKDPNFVPVYIDDVVICSKKMTDHMDHISVVCARIRKAGLKLKLKKCVFEVEELEVLRHILSSATIKVDRKRGYKVSEETVPRTEKELSSFLMFRSFYGRFVRDLRRYRLPSAPLPRIRRRLNGGEHTHVAFSTMKHR